MRLIFGMCSSERVKQLEKQQDLISLKNIFFQILHFQIIHFSFIKLYKNKV